MSDFDLYEERIAELPPFDAAHMAAVAALQRLTLVRIHADHFLKGVEPTPQELRAALRNLLLATERLKRKFEPVRDAFSSLHKAPIIYQDSPHESYLDAAHSVCFSIALAGVMTEADYTHGLATHIVKDPRDSALLSVWLRKELLAVKAAHGGAFYLGRGRLRVDGVINQLTASQQIQFIEHLITHDDMATTVDLNRSGVSNPSEVARKLTEAFDGALRPYLTLPSTKGQGYRSLIVDLRKTS